MSISSRQQRLHRGGLGIKGFLMAEVAHILAVLEYKGYPNDCLVRRGGGYDW